MDKFVNRGLALLKKLEELGCEPVPVGNGQYMAHCPFHDDRNRSFSLDTKTSFCNCFAKDCDFPRKPDEEGTYWGFMSRLRVDNTIIPRKPLSTTQRVQKHRTIKYEQKIEKDKAVVSPKLVTPCYRYCINYWHKQLLENNEYLTHVCDTREYEYITRHQEKKGDRWSEKHLQYISPDISTATIKKNLIGFAPKNPKPLIKELMERGYEKDVLISTGLFTRHGSNGLKCMMSGRVIYPYLKNKKPVYCIGRHTIHTSNSRLFSKYIKQKVNSDNYQLLMSNPQFMFLDNVLDKEKIVLTEGVTDALKLQEIGIPAFSAVGTRITKEGLEFIYDELFDRKIIIIFDNDKNDEGNNASRILQDFLADKEIDARIVELPREKGEDKMDICLFLQSGGDLHRLIQKQTYISFHHF